MFSQIKNFILDMLCHIIYYLFGKEFKELESNGNYMPNYLLIGFKVRTNSPVVIKLIKDLMNKSNKSSKDIHYDCNYERNNHLIYVKRTCFRLDKKNEYGVTNRIVRICEPSSSEMHKLHDIHENLKTCGQIYISEIKDYDHLWHMGNSLLSRNYEGTGRRMYVRSSDNKLSFINLCSDEKDDKTQ